MPPAKSFETALSGISISEASPVTTSSSAPATSASVAPIALIAEPLCLSIFTASALVAVTVIVFISEPGIATTLPAVSSILPVTVP